jgi:5'-deoxynucleotidase
LETVLEGYALPEVNYFLQIFIPSFSLSLDEISLQDGQL